MCNDWNRIQTTYVKTIRWGKNGQIKKIEEREEKRRRVRKRQRGGREGKKRQERWSGKRGEE